VLDNDFYWSENLNVLLFCTNGFASAAIGADETLLNVDEATEDATAVVLRTVTATKTAVAAATTAPAAMPMMAGVENAVDDEVDSSLTNNPVEEE
jgi:hypothetical protein